MKIVYLALPIISNFIFVFPSSSSTSSISRNSLPKNPLTNISSYSPSLTSSASKSPSIISIKSNSADSTKSSVQSFNNSFNSSVSTIANDAPNPYKVSGNLIQYLNSIKSKCFSCEQLVEDEKLTKAEFIDYMNEAFRFCCENNEYQIIITLLNEFHPIIEPELFLNMLQLSIKNNNPKLFMSIKGTKNFTNLNKNDFIDKLLEDYNKESDGSKLKEKNSKWLNDDYVKFIRYSESYIEKNQE